jgi:putative membrane protein
MPTEESTRTPPPLPGIDGFLGTRASLGMDVVLIGLFAVLPLLAWSIFLVRYKRAYRGHRLLQILIAGALLMAILFFEIDVRLLSDWKLRAAASPFWPLGVLTALGVHLVFAISTLVLWILVLWEAFRRFPHPPAPGTHGPRHRRLARLAAADLLATTVTGTLFYWLAFVAA